jgi:DtxR family Mn-dependent transcriptional regulator
MTIKETTLRVPASCRPADEGRTKSQFTESVEEYSEGIFRLQQDSEKVTTGELATYMTVSPGSVTTMVKKLQELGLVNHEKYQGIRLTPMGEQLAKQLTRTHRILEVFLVDMLELPWNDVHELACKLEHYLPDDLIRRIERKLGHPKTCPHGNPVNPEEPHGSYRLREAHVGDHLQVVRITDERVEFLHHLEELQLTPGAEFDVLGSEPFDELIRLRINGNEHTVGRAVSTHLWVKKPS